MLGTDVSRTGKVIFFSLTVTKDIPETIFCVPMIIYHGNRSWFYQGKGFHILQDCVEKLFGAQVHPGIVIRCLNDKVLRLGKLAGGYILISCRGMGGIIINFLFCTDFHVQKFEDKKDFEKFHSF